MLPFGCSLSRNLGFKILFRAHIGLIKEGNRYLFGSRLFQNSVLQFYFDFTYWLSLTHWLYNTVGFKILFQFHRLVILTNIINWLCTIVGFKILYQFHKSQPMSLMPHWLYRNRVSRFYFFQFHKLVIPKKIILVSIFVLRLYSNLSNWTSVRR